MFDGVDDYVNTLLNPSTQLENTFTISAWINPHSQNNYRGVAGSHGGNYQGIVFFQYANVGWEIGFGDGSAWQTVNMGELNLNCCIMLLEFIKLALVDILKYIYNGTEVIQKNVSTTISHLTSFSIGRALNSTDRYFDGIVDTISVYNRELTPSEILSNYNAGNVELRTRVGNSTDPNDGTWEEWKPETSETTIDSMDSDSTNWSWDLGTSATFIPQSLSDDTNIKMEGTSSLKIQTGIGQTDVNTVALWHLDETSGTGAYLKDSTSNANNGTPPVPLLSTASLAKPEVLMGAVIIFLRQ
jgi:hypothetical protein